MQRTRDFQLQREGLPLPRTKADIIAQQTIEHRSSTSACHKPSCTNIDITTAQCQQPREPRASTGRNMVHVCASQSSSCGSTSRDVTASRKSKPSTRCSRTSSRALVLEKRVFPSKSKSPNLASRAVSPRCNLSSYEKIATQYRESKKDKNKHIWDPIKAYANATGEEKILFDDLYTSLETTMEDFGFPGPTAAFTFPTNSQGDRHEKGGVDAKGEESVAEAKATPDGGEAARAEAPEDEA
ncbi:hypothetical protein DOTSEDRAFT_69024 [Dothistroma septosporum NZE10]|uniref:Uncharacterized protein n=1 Tax=Dothistroma septosporum (strain NZE10 / CBS 128990) TaxID=675120 RepID=N1Q5B9_DOTSN|nr:hypothetical protein DOTSEDRAFT_69024 [Dothistroma septosporum NZE10]